MCEIPMKHLAEIAMDYLSIPAQNVNAEHEFSVVSKIIGLKRLKLTESNVEVAALFTLSKEVTIFIFAKMNGIIIY